ncbi:hypothetical protein HPB49_013371 [Dermacentor silvarum]|uniref:Uncharacterized protein n=1 Tax=Dermacentor silvarum TaxID=543639 RepID=A0ACB8CF89_DERSI|nr:hypothetical protein HPB49_013371 [Dermacentor silvarum]
MVRGSKRAGQVGLRTLSQTTLASALVVRTSYARLRKPSEGSYYLERCVRIIIASYVMMPDIAQSCSDTELEPAAPHSLSIDLNADCEINEAANASAKVTGDRHADSPGYSAKYGVYSMLETNLNRIIDIELGECNEVSSSTHMELEGLKRALASLDESGVNVTEVVTDRHPQVRRYFKSDRPEMDHLFDAWHVYKMPRGAAKRSERPPKLREEEANGARARRHGTSSQCSSQAGSSSEFLGLTRREDLPGETSVARCRASRSRAWTRASEETGLLLPVLEALADPSAAGP